MDSVTVTYSRKNKGPVAQIRITEAVTPDQKSTIVFDIDDTFDFDKFIKGELIIYNETANIRVKGTNYKFSIAASNGTSITRYFLNTNPLMAAFREKLEKVSTNLSSMKISNVTYCVYDGTLRLYLNRPPFEAYIMLAPTAVQARRFVEGFDAIESDAAIDGMSWRLSKCDKCYKLENFNTNNHSAVHATYKFDEDDPLISEIKDVIRECML